MMQIRLACTLDLQNNTTLDNEESVEIQHSRTQLYLIDDGSRIHTAVNTIKAHNMRTDIYHWLYG